jgi:hypothetical protein
MITNQETIKNRYVISQPYAINETGPAKGLSHARLQAETVFGVTGTARFAFYGSSRLKQPLIVKVPSESRKIVVETGLALTKRLFRALLSQLHPGRMWNPESERRKGRKDLRRGPDYQRSTGKGVSL